MVYLFGAQLKSASWDYVNELELGAIIITNSAQAKENLDMAGMVYDSEINLLETIFCKVEIQPECISGSFAIPKLLDVLGSRYQMQFFVNKKYIVIVDDDGFAQRLVTRIQKSKTNQGDTKAKFLYNFISEFMNRDISLLESIERELMELEDMAMHGKVDDILSRLIPTRKKLLTMRGYYDQLSDMGKELEENENKFFTNKQAKLFGILTDRAERLMGKTMHLIDYAQQVRDAYQAQIDAKQNSNMQFLTIISTIFFPLTLITGWYGMNFQNMPELQSGYPYVIGGSLLVVITCIVIFKIKKIL